ncbi:hypothetical protein BOX15_Mlig005887g1, partial [Macrostomum lignano]
NATSAAACLFINPLLRRRKGQILFGCHHPEPAERALMEFRPLKTINDPVHGTIQVHSFAELIMDRPQFQRLRHLKQLALTDLVYPSATKTRFEHSLGTYHLAWELGKKLRSCLPESEFSDSEALCAAIAGLCHDLGHGPFSHLWESLLKSCGIDYHHEAMSVQVFQSIVTDIASRQDQESMEFSAFMDRCWRPNWTHKQLVCDLIRGGPGGDSERIPPEKQFLFEFVNNKRTGYDVDKLDYMNRDALSLGLPNRFDATRQLSLLRVLPCPGNRKLLVLRDKQVLDYINLLISRRMQHYLAYQHVKSVAFEKVLQDALSAARRHLQAHRDDPDVNRLAIRYLLDEPESLESLLWLTDDRLVELLKQSCGSEAARLMKHLEERRKYRHLASVRVALHSTADDEATAVYKNQLEAVKIAVTHWNASRSRSIAELRKFDYGCGPQHPLDSVFCYSKNGEVRQCNGDGDSESLLFADLQLAALHITVVRLYERTAGEPPADAAAVKEFRRREVADFREKMSACGFKPTAE